MKEKILITGASGFVGGHLIRAAQQKGLEVHAAVRKTSNIQHIEADVDKFQYLDYEDEGSLRQLFSKEKYQYIIHAAALTTAKSEEQIQKVNVDYTLALIKSVFLGYPGTKRFVYVSSVAAIGPLPYEQLAITEQTVHNPITMYGRSKSRSEEMIQDKFSNLPITIIRPTAVYGPEEKDIFLLFKTMASGLDPYIGRKPQKLSFIYVADLVDVLLKACAQAGSPVRYYNVSDGRAYSRYEMADIFSSLFKKKLFRVHIPSWAVRQVAKLMQQIYKNSSKTPVLYPERVNELTAENWECDISKAMDELGYIPRVQLSEGLKKTLYWYKQNKWL